MDCFNKMPKDENLNFIVSRMRGVTAFGFAEQVLAGSMFLEAGSGDATTGHDIVRDWTIGLQFKIIDFHAQTMDELFRQYGLINKGEECELRDEYCAKRGEICIPITALEPSNTELNE
jgi:hypothetical protein